MSLQQLIAKNGIKKCSPTWKKTEEKTIHPYLALVGTLPDAPHLAKSLKASFSNWYLTLFNELGCLSFLHTLSNKSDFEEMKIMNLMIQNDYVRNKGRQDPIAV